MNEQIKIEMQNSELSTITVLPSYIGDFYYEMIVKEYVTMHMYNNLIVKCKYEIIHQTLIIENTHASSVLDPWIWKNTNCRKKCQNDSTYDQYLRDLMLKNTWKKKTLLMK